MARGVLGNLSNKTPSYGELILGLKERFLPRNQTQLYIGYNLGDRRQRVYILTRDF
jgi:hypothetical protein